MMRFLQNKKLESKEDRKDCLSPPQADYNRQVNCMAVVSAFYIKGSFVYARKVLLQGVV